MSEIANNNTDFLMPGSDPEASVQAKDLLGQTPVTGSLAAPPRLLDGGLRFRLAFGLLGGYALFFFSLYLADRIEGSGFTAFAGFGGWLAGCAVLLRSALHAKPSARPVIRIDLLLALWCNAGIVAFATFLGGEMRLEMLIGVVFGLLYSGLQFSEGRVRSVMLFTLLAYAFCVGLKSTLTPLSLEFELLCLLGLCVLLFSASLVSREIIRLRAEAGARNRQLTHALRRVEELALRDELTGLYNRRHLLDYVERAIAARERGGPEFALAYCDLDHFKRVNDRFGHECGDRLLQSFADAALSSVRTNDLVARLGGEEFVLVLVDADESEARDIVERLRMRTASIRVSNAEPTYRITLSSGLTSHREDDTVERILRRADTALYEAKDEGRDRLVCA